MSAEIKSVNARWGTVRMGPSSYKGAVYIEAPEEGTSVLRTDLLAAVATECDAIAIPRADVPTVKVTCASDSVARIDGAWYALDSADARGVALAFLALAEYQAAHPPVDVAQVEALETALREVGPATIADIARRLVARGVRVDLP